MRYLNLHCSATIILLVSACGMVGCSGQPELISPAAKATPDKTKAAADATIDGGSTSSAVPAELPADSGEQQTLAAKQKQPDSEVLPASHVVEVAMPTIARRSKLDGPAGISKVLLSTAEQKSCKLNVGDHVPDIALPSLSGQLTKLEDLTGEKLTVLVFWHPLDPYATWELADLTPDVLKPYESHGVGVVGICSGSVDAPIEPAVAQSAMEHAAAKFPGLLDAQGEVMQQFGSDRPSRTYLIDAEGKILWFDIEYSRSTRRELKAALAFLLDKPAKAKPAGE